MAGFTNYEDIITKLTVDGNGFLFDFAKGPFTPQAVCWWYSYWAIDGIPAAGVAPAASPGTAYVDALGSINFPDRSPDQTHLLTFGAVSTQWGNLVLYDRLVGVGGVTLAPAGAKTINSVALPRYTDGAGVEVWVEVTTVTAGAAAGTVALSSYTNQDGVAGRSGAPIAFPFAASNAATAIGPLPLQAGDTGVRSVEQITTAISTAGVVNVVLLRPLVSLPLSRFQWADKDMLQQVAAIPRIYPGASLALLVQNLNNAEVRLWGQLGIGWG
jgi:hypothetical protein